MKCFVNNVLKASIAALCNIIADATERNEEQVRLVLRFYLYYLFIVFFLNSGQPHPRPP